MSPTERCDLAGVKLENVNERLDSVYRNLFEFWFRNMINNIKHYRHLLAGNTVPLTVCCDNVVHHVFAKTVFTADRISIYPVWVN